MGLEGHRYRLGGPSGTIHFWTFAVFALLSPVMIVGAVLGSDALLGLAAIINLAFFAILLWARRGFRVVQITRDGLRFEPSGRTIAAGDILAIEWADWSGVGAPRFLKLEMPGRCLLPFFGAVWAAGSTIWIGRLYPEDRD